MKDEMKKNGSGCYDPTAYKAIKKVDKEYENYFKDKNESLGSDERFDKLLKTIFNICELSGFHIEGRIVIKDKKTGKIYR